MKKKFLTIALMAMFLAPVYAQRGERDAAPAAQEVVSIFMKDKILLIQNARPGEKIEILNILGIRIYEKRADGSNIELVLDLPQGYYIVKVGNTVRKISIK